MNSKHVIRNICICGIFQSASTLEALFGLGRDRALVLSCGGGLVSGVCLVLKVQLSKNWGVWRRKSARDRAIVCTGKGKVRLHIPGGTRYKSQEKFNPRFTKCKVAFPLQLVTSSSWNVQTRKKCLSFVPLLCWMPQISSAELLFCDIGIWLLWWNFLSLSVVIVVSGH